MASAMEGGVEHSKKLCTLGHEFRNYDVFISHRGPDTKTTFVGYLYDRLKKVGLVPFLDCTSIGEGQHSWECIDHAIQSTPLALVIFSENFVQSEWCLKELHAMLKATSVKVLPIFYKIQPSEVRFPKKGQVDGECKRLLEKYGEIVIEEWTVDVEKASEINGWVWSAGDKRLEKDLVEEVVGKIFELANKPLPLDVGDYIVGVEQVAKNLIQTIVEKKVLMLGLWGMGGIGKSTLARELYNQLERRFDVRCYVEDVSEKVTQGGVTSVQNHILKALCENDSTWPIVDKSRGKVILEERLSKKGFLVVLDDVRDDDEIENLLSRKMLKEGSLCIVTSRNRRAFEKQPSFQIKHEIYTHDIQLLSKEDSQHVFACHAFGGDRKVPSRFEGLVGDVSMACGGVPLVLKVCGSLLRDEEDVEIWKDVLKQLNCGTIMDDKKIFKCLRISYDSLEENQQEMFLDIACALLGASVEMSKLVWRSQGWSAALGVRSLVEKALIRVDGSGVFCMHDHLRDMGRAISKHKRSSVDCSWDSTSLALLNKNESLPSSLQTLVIPWRLQIHIDLSLMKGLRIFKSQGGLFLMSSLPGNLRWLYCKGVLHTSSIPFPEVPVNNELVILHWQGHSIDRLPESFGHLKKLEVLYFRCRYKLRRLPDSFGGLQSLRNLDLEGTGIQSLPESFGKLSNLEVLNLRRCGMLVKLPDLFGDLENLKSLDLVESGIRSLPESFGKLSNLEVLNLRCCGELVELPDLFGGLQNLTHLCLAGTGIQSLPKYFGHLRKLEVLNLWHCHKLVELSDLFGGLQNLKSLYLGQTRIQSLPETLGKLSNLEVLNLQGCVELVKLPDLFGGLHNLRNLILEGSGIQSVPEFFGKLSNLEVVKP